MQHDVSLESTRGTQTRLSDHRGKVVVVFYEAKGHTADNEALKQACGRLVSSGRMRGRLEVLGVADLTGFGFGPVKAVVRKAVGAVAASYGTELHMDFTGALQAAPLSLPGGGASVAILGPDSEVVFRARGRLDATDVERFFEVLSATLERTGPRVSLPNAA